MTATDGGPERRLFLLGRDIQHSLSPLTWGGVFDELGLPWSYGLRDVEEYELPKVLDELREDAVLGCNVTMPYKQWAVGQVDERDQWVDRAGVCNWLSWQDGRLVSTNTDAEGTARLLSQTDRAELALLLGAGGAAGAALAGLDGRAEKVVVASRTRARAEEQAERASAWLQGISVVDWDDRMDVASRADLIINTTPIGMAGRPGSPLDDMTARDNLRIIDAVYGREPTDLDRQAAAWGAAYTDGLCYLSNQAISMRRLIGLEHVSAEVVERHLTRTVGRAPRRWSRSRS